MRTAAADDSQEDKIQEMGWWICIADSEKYNGYIDCNGCTN